MQAIVCLGGGKYYISEVFGYYNGRREDSAYARDGNDIFSKYYIVLDQEKKKLVRHYQYDVKMRPEISPQILLLNNSTEGWILNEDGTGGVDFLVNQRIERMFNVEFVPSELIDECIKIDAANHYDEFMIVRNRKNADNLLLVAGSFHDAMITELFTQEDGALYVKFNGTWGCSIEMWFIGNVEYCVTSRSSDNDDPFWFTSSIVFADEYIYFIDEEDVGVEELGDKYCWFKARHLKYHIIPE